MENTSASGFASKNALAFSIVMRTTSGWAEQSWFVRTPFSRANHSGFCALFAAVGAMIRLQAWPKKALTGPTRARTRRLPGVGAGTARPDESADGGE